MNTKLAPFISMRKLPKIFLATALFMSITAAFADAQMDALYKTEGPRSGMMGDLDASDINWNEVVEHTVREEKEGKELWEKLQAKQVTCADLSDEDFGVLGEYFMGAMMGDSHAAMNAMMIQMHGKEGEEQIHIVMGKRLSGCDTSAVFPMGSGGWMPMMNIFTPYGGGGFRSGMMGGWSSPFEFNPINNMMNFGTFGFFGGLFMILWWGLIIAGIVALVKWLLNQSRGSASGKSALEILKERYAKDEINKQEFEDKKKDIV